MSFKLIIEQELDLKYEIASSNLYQLTQKLELPYVKPSEDIIEIFKVQRPEVKESVIDRLNFYSSICEHAVSQGLNTKSEANFAWYALQKLKMIPSDNMFSHVDQDDSIEIYDSMGLQIYRSFNFSKYTKYSLEELMIYPWYELYSRDEKITHLMMEVMKKLIVSKNEDIVFLDMIPTHFCKETMGKYNWVTKVRFKIAAPLQDKLGNTVGFIATQKLERHNDLLSSVHL